MQDNVISGALSFCPASIFLHYSHQHEQSRNPVLLLLWVCLVCLFLNMMMAIISNTDMRAVSVCLSLTEPSFIAFRTLPIYYPPFIHLAIVIDSLFQGQSPIELAFQLAQCHKVRVNCILWNKRHQPNQHIVFDESLVLSWKPNHSFTCFVDQ